MAALRIEVLRDDYPHYRLVRVGNWILMHDYETLEGEWEWDPEERDERPAITSSTVQASL